MQHPTKIPVFPSTARILTVGKGGEHRIENENLRRSDPPNSTETTSESIRLSS
jgi:hypothetical protein